MKKFYKIIYKNDQNIKIIINYSPYSQIFPSKMGKYILNVFKKDEKNITIEDPEGYKTEIETKEPIKGKKTITSFLGAIILSCGLGFGGTAYAADINNVKSPPPNILSHSTTQVIKLAAQDIKNPTINPSTIKRSNLYLNQNVVNINKSSNFTMNKITENVKLISNSSAKHKFEKLNQEDKNFVKEITNQILDGEVEYLFKKYCEIMEIKPTKELFKQYKDIFTKHIKINITNSEYDYTKELGHGFSGYYNKLNKNINLFIPGLYNPDFLKKLKENPKLMKIVIEIGKITLSHELGHEQINFKYDKENNKIIFYNTKIALPELVAEIYQNGVNVNITEKDILEIYKELYNLNIINLNMISDRVDLLKKNKKELLKIYREEYKNGNLSKEELVIAKLLSKSSIITISNNLENFLAFLTNERDKNINHINSTEYPQLAISSFLGLEKNSIIKKIMVNPEKYYKIFQNDIDDTFNMVKNNKISNNDYLKFSTILYYFQQNMDKLSKQEQNIVLNYLQKLAEKIYKEGLGFFGTMFDGLEIQKTIPKVNYSNILPQNNSNIAKTKKEIKELYYERHSL